MVAASLYTRLVFFVVEVWIYSNQRIGCRRQSTSVDLRATKSLLLEVASPPCTGFMVGFDVTFVLLGTSLELVN